jgi:hypothetical protein
VTKRWTRRDFLKDTGLGAATLSLGTLGCRMTDSEPGATLRDERPGKPEAPA